MNEQREQNISKTEIDIRSHQKTWPDDATVL